MNLRQARWSLFITHFNFTDALSCIYPSERENGEPENILPHTCCVNVVEWDFDKEISNTFPHHVPPECSADRIYVPPQLRSKLITWAHMSPALGHPGTLRTLDLI